ncbi:MAG: redoxin domain-containing protein [Gammaproteobacteria bacterium]|nr:redoxin domain-containing protein [Gammaproteobacteria bacterium]
MPSKPYNAKRFKIGIYDFDAFSGPAAGEPAIDFELYELATGDKVTLSDLRGRWVVLETGSATCSMYTKNIPGIEDLIEKHADVDFYMVYVREAHPGERLGAHKNVGEKQAAARMLERRYGESRRILIDNCDGDFHLAYGAMPNMLYVIRPDGIVHYRCDWSTVDGLDHALTHRDAPIDAEHADMKQLNASRSLGIAIRTMWTGGFLALWDFLLAIPGIARQHEITDTYYREHGHLRRRSRES